MPSLGLIMNTRTKIDLSPNNRAAPPRPRAVALYAACVLLTLLSCTVCIPAPGLTLPGSGNPPAGSALPEEVYLLPFAPGAGYLVGQGAFGVAGVGSHANQYAIDFVLPMRTPVLAARTGKVVGMRQSCPDVSCPFTPDTCCGNYVRIQHADGSIAAYWHLPQNGACVKVGDAVERGDIIAVSGNTGISLAPHLHFAVSAPKGQTGTGRFGPSADGTMEVPFADVAGDGVPTFLNTYGSQNAVLTDHCAAGSAQ